MKSPKAVNSRTSDSVETCIPAGQEICHDAVFGEVTDEGPNYRNLGWIATIVMMLKLQIGLGVLSLPEVFDALGMIPGVILLLVVSAIATWTSYMVGAFKLNHPEVYSIDDAGGLIFGRIGREFFAICDIAM